MNIVLIASGEFAVDSLEVLVEDPDFAIDLVITQPDRVAGRGRSVRPTPIKERALALELPVITPEKIRDEKVISRIRDLAPEALVVVAYGQKIPRSILDLPTLTSVNVHGSLLPFYRGASPIEGAILGGETTTGVTIQLVADEIDAGDLVLQESLEIEPDDNAESLTRRLASLGAKLLPQALKGLAGKTLVPTPQDHDRATLTRKIKKHHGLISWKEPAEDIVNKIRAYYPWPGAYGFFFSSSDDKKKNSGQKLTLTRARVTSTNAESPDLRPGTITSVTRDQFAVLAGSGKVEILALQRPGKKEMDTASFLRGFALEVGDELRSESGEGPPPSSSSKTSDHS